MQRCCTLATSARSPRCSGAEHARDASTSASHEQHAGSLTHREEDTSASTCAAPGLATAVVSAKWVAACGGGGARAELAEGGNASRASHACSWTGCWGRARRNCEYSAGVSRAAHRRLLWTGLLGQAQCAEEPTNVSGRALGRTDATRVRRRRVVATSTSVWPDALGARIETGLERWSDIDAEWIDHLRVGQLLRLNSEIRVGDTIATSPALSCLLWHLIWMAT